jgi:trk system potassium uptake protein TrkH
MVVFAASVMLLAADGYDFTTNFTAVAATINNIGPGLSGVGPTCNYGFFSPLSKLVMMFDMLVGRLELFPMLILFMPSTWKK